MKQSLVHQLRKPSSKAVKKLAALRGHGRTYRGMQTQGRLRAFSQ